MISSSIIYLLNGNPIHCMENNKRKKMIMKLNNKKVEYIRMNLQDKSNNSGLWKIPVDYEKTSNYIKNKKHIEENK